jgi:uncharacterized protein (DUF1015 family)
MARFEPFRGVRYDISRVDLADTTAPPYDVIDEEQRASLLVRHPKNAVRVDLPADEDGRDRYEVARDLFAAWQRDGTLLPDSEPSFYVYSMGYVDDLGRPRDTIGVIGELELHPAGHGGILPHEHTTPKAKSDRLEMLRSCRANLSPVWGLSPSVGLTAMLGVDEAPIADWADDDGVRHRLWRLTDPGRLATISEAVGAEAFVIADGHHRYETSLAYRDERTAADGDPGDAARVMVWVVELAEEHLTVRPIHRLLTGLTDPGELVTRLGQCFEVAPWGDPVDLGPSVTETMVEQGQLVLVLPDRAYTLHPRPAAFEGVRDLDTSRLDHALAGLDVDLVYQHGVERVVGRVREGDAPAGVLLRPATVPQILDVAHGGERMPPKTTFFHPKPKTGVVFRLLP